jgi:1,4-dihydroxy-2-naphthoate octaprenyltransferase
MTKIWLIAARPGSVVKIILPIMVGLSIGYAHTGEVRVTYILFALFFGWLDQLTIIFLNDFADAEADTLHTEKYPELIDKRAIPKGWLKKRDLLVAGLTCTVLMLFFSAALALFFQRTLAPLFGVLAIGLLWAYSFWPIKLNYRGMGELLETIGVGGVLPWIGFYFHTGQIGMPLTGIVPLILLAFASAVSSGIKHMPADKEAGKNTASVLFGTRMARFMIISLLTASIAYCALFALLGFYHWASLLLTVALPLVFWWVATRHLKTADHSNLLSLKKFNGSLHKAIYATNLGICLSFVLNHAR